MYATHETQKPADLQRGPRSKGKSTKRKILTEGVWGVVGKRDRGEGNNQCRGALARSAPAIHWCILCPNKLSIAIGWQMKYYQYFENN